ncbi:rhomboid family intramembrane serine protease [Leptothoe kymatousa]|uniref:Rhomboid family intramembrane serine protease n=1 Tax=Leptothoe kymatousa TAU-MAC 1615 TaxID=2364775 RepID=A0ABS5Y1W3_9CYAN|nr:rhomboid family intramembrane serine protease [Leptothoe kymatousa]MBT9311811.1 rhomboid family intramembrane serine protease [Leptothoe kymatousa TAU-MAC 1615]
MVPLNDNNPTRTTPYVVFGLIALNVVLFFYELSLQGAGEQALDQFFRVWAIVPAELTDSFVGRTVNPVGEWFTLISSQFLHGGWAHLGGNMLYLWIFGNNIEDQLGHGKFIVFYLACGALAGLAQWVFMPSSIVPTLGASGAIAGIMGAYIIRFPRAQILTLLPLFILITTVRIPAIFFLGWWFVQQAFYGVASLGANADMGAGGVAYWAHAGGFVFGVILGPLLGLFPKGQGPFKSRR